MLDWIKKLFQSDLGHRLEQYIVARKPQHPGDVDRMTQDFYRKEVRSWLQKKHFGILLLNLLNSIVNIVNNSFLVYGGDMLDIQQEYEEIQEHIRELELDGYRVNEELLAQLERLEVELSLAQNK